MLASNYSRSGHGRVSFGLIVVVVVVVVFFLGGGGGDSSIMLVFDKLVVLNFWLFSPSISKSLTNPNLPSPPPPPTNQPHL